MPSLTKAAATWATKGVTQISQRPLTRAFEASTIRLTHFWIDLRHCNFNVTSSEPPQAAAAPTPVQKPKKKSRKK